MIFLDDSVLANQATVQDSKQAHEHLSSKKGSIWRELVFEMEEGVSGNFKMTVPDTRFPADDVFSFLKPIIAIYTRIPFDYTSYFLDAT